MEIGYKEFIKEAQEHQKGKVCQKCKEHKLLSEFSKHKNRLPCSALVQ